MSKKTQDIAQVFEDLVARADKGVLTDKIALVVDDKTALQGRDPKGRGHACCCWDPKKKRYTIFIAKKLVDADRARQEGVLAHELGHIALLSSGIEEHSEREADAEAHRVLGVHIYYDRDFVQTTSARGTYAQRPTELDLRENPGRDHGCVHKNPAPARRRKLNASFRAYLNEKYANTLNHKNGRFAQKTRAYGDYLFAQDRAMFDVELESALNGDPRFVDWRRP